MLSGPGTAPELGCVQHRRPTTYQYVITNVVDVLFNQLDLMVPTCTLHTAH